MLFHAHGRHARRLRDLTAKLEPAQERAHVAEEVPPRLRALLAVREPQAPVLERAVGHLVDRDAVEEREVPTRRRESLELADEVR